MDPGNPFSIELFIIQPFECAGALFGSQSCSAVYFFRGMLSQRPPDKIITAVTLLTELLDKLTNYFHGTVLY